MARGYLNDPDLTSTAFVHGLAWAPDKRLYRTGDLARYVVDARGHMQLHFVGRRDSQIKIHGQRMEPGEIERVMVLQPHTRHALVLAPKRGPCAGLLVGVMSLVEPRMTSSLKISAGSDEGIVLVDGSWEAHIRDTTDFLRDRLPAYMTPEVFVIVEAIHRNSSGKLDRKKMQNIIETMSDHDHQQLISRISGEGGADRPGSEMEMAMRSIWSQVLNVPDTQIRWDTSFFFLGETYEAVILS